MTGVLFVTWDGGGNVPPALGIAAELRRRGDAVRFLGHPSQREAIEASGFVAEEYQHARPWSVLEPRSGMRAPLAYAAVFTDRGIGEDLVASVRRQPTDRVIIDGLLVGGMQGARRAGIPYTVLAHTLYGVLAQTLNHGPLSLLARGRGLNPARLYRSAERILAVTLEELDFGAHEGVDYTGPVLPRAVVSRTAPPVVVNAEGRAEGSRGVRPEPVPGDPLVLVSLSTTFIAGQRETLQRIIDVLGGMPVRAIVTTGPAVDPHGLRAPAHVEVHRYLPHSQEMPGASLVISHGGHATTMLALAHDLPLLIVPMNPFSDQPAIGRVIAERGAGLTIGRSAPTVEIRRAIERLLPEPRPWRDAAARLGERIRSRDGAVVAADLIESDAAPREL